MKTSTNYMSSLTLHLVITARLRRYRRRCHKRLPQHLEGHKSSTITITTIQPYASTMVKQHQRRRNFSHQLTTNRNGSPLVICTNDANIKRPRDHTRKWLLKFDQKLKGGQVARRRNTSVHWDWSPSGYVFPEDVHDNWCRSSGNIRGQPKLLERDWSVWHYWKTYTGDVVTDTAQIRIQEQRNWIIHVQVGLFASVNDVYLALALWSEVWKHDVSVQSPVLLWIDQVSVQTTFLTTNRVFLVGLKQLYRN